MPCESRYGPTTTALDVDAELGGEDSWRELIDEIGTPPVTATVDTKTAGCFHLWLQSSGQWQGLPAELMPGIELKRAGHLVVSPPTVGYRFRLHPAEVGVTRWPALEMLLFDRLYAPQTPADEVVVEEVVVEDRRSDLAWGEADDLVFGIATAPPGRRTDALRRLGGRAAWLTMFGRGFPSEDELEQALWRACLTSGIVEEYGEAETRRKVASVMKLARPETNRYAKGLQLSRGEEGSFRLLVRLAPGQKAVLLDVVERCGWSLKHAPTPYASRYGALRTGLDQSAVTRALHRLVAEGLLKAGPPQWNADGRKATKTYRPTMAGIEMARMIRADKEAVNRCTTYPT